MIEGVLVNTPEVHRDSRGSFTEVFRKDEFNLDVMQVNCSVSAKGVIRGIHFAENPPGQAKYVTCIKGAIMDVIVDIRTGSPDFGAWDAVYLDDQDRKAVYVSEGLGHAFQALTDDCVVCYLCSAVHAPAREHSIHPLDPDIGIGWDAGFSLSARDGAAPSLAQVRDLGLLPR